MNRQEDIQDGKQFLSNFYNDIKKRQLDSIDIMASDTLQKIIGPKGISKLINLVNRKVGNYKSYSILNSYTRHTEGTNSGTLYRFKLKVTYDKVTIDEILGMEKQNNSAIKILSYNVYSDLLLK